MLCMSNTSTETACLKLIFTKFACSMKKVPVRHTGAYCHKKALVTTKMLGITFMGQCSLISKVILSTVCMAGNSLESRHLAEKQVSVLA